MDAPNKANNSEAAAASPAVKLSDSELARNRERNREHARRTRLRKKIRLQTMKNKILELQEEWHCLRQLIEDCRCASLLVQMSAPSGALPADLSTVVDYQTDLFSNASDSDSGAVEVRSPTSHGSFDATFPSEEEAFLDSVKKDSLCSGDVTPSAKSKRPREMALGEPLGGEELGDLVGIFSVKKPKVSKSYMDARKQLHGMTEQLRLKGEMLTSEEAENIRREKNRIHAKLTRERKKLYTSAMEESIHQLDGEIKHMRGVVAKARMAAQAGDTLPLPPFYPQFACLHTFNPNRIEGHEESSPRLSVA